MFTGKDSRGRFITVESTINGTMPDISPDSSVRVNPFKEVYRREDPGRVESDGTVTFEVDGQANGFSVLQNIAYDELEGCDIGFYSFDVVSRVLLFKFDARQNYSGVAIKSFIVNASTPDSEYNVQLIMTSKIFLERTHFIDEQPMNITSRSLVRCYSWSIHS